MRVIVFVGAIIAASPGATARACRPTHAAGKGLEHVLDAALDAGVPYPFGCQSGNCGACKSRLYQGEVEMAPYSEFALTEEERKTILGYRPGGGPDGLWVLTTTRGDDLPVAEVLYLPDDQQVGLAESADPRPWMIPVFHEDDPGGA